jgi:peptidoglycan/xylan/chitin deacetylase (PgdA/CDA1 family)
VGGRWIARAWVIIVAATAAAHILTRPAAAQPDADWSEIVRGDADTNVVALTFDAGGPVEPAQRVLDTLRSRGVHATFFLSGIWIEAHPEMGLQIVQDGHELANHSYTHPDLTRLTRAQIIWELVHTDDIVFGVTGRHTRPYARMPFGARNARVLEAAQSAGFRSVYWTLDSTDWRTEATPERVLTRVLRFVQPGDIVVQHSSTESTAASLGAILDDLQARGWRIGTLSEVLGVATSAPPLPADRWWLAGPSAP